MQTLPDKATAPPAAIERKAGRSGGDVTGGGNSGCNRFGGRWRWELYPQFFGGCCHQAHGGRDLDLWASHINVVALNKPLNKDLPLHKPRKPQAGQLCTPSCHQARCGRSGAVTRHGYQRRPSARATFTRTLKSPLWPLAWLFPRQFPPLVSMNGERVDADTNAARCSKPQQVSGLVSAKSKQSTQILSSLKSARCSKVSAQKCTTAQQKRNKTQQVQARKIPLKGGIQAVLCEQDWTKPNHDLRGIQAGIRQTRCW